MIEGFYTIRKLIVSIEEEDTKHPHIFIDRHIYRTINEPHTP